MWTSPLVRRTLWWLMFALCVLVLLASSRYLMLDPDQYFPEQRAVYLDRQAVLHLHIIGAMAALAIGPFQFWTGLRRRRPRVHKAIGRAYVLAVMSGGVGGLLLATSAYGGAVASAGFAGLAVAWLATLAMAITAIRRGDIANHKRWMIRCFALTFTGVTLRLYLGAFSGLTAVGLTDVAFVDAYVVVAWLSWVPNLAIAWWLTTPRRLPVFAAARTRELVTRAS